MALEPISAEDLDALRRFDTCTVSNAIETFEVRLRNAGFADARIRCMFEDFPPMVGYAATAQLRSGEPSDYGENLLGPYRLVEQHSASACAANCGVGGPGQTSGLGRFLGDMHAAILRALGCVGYVTDGAVRELPRVKALGTAVVCRECGGVACLCPHLRLWVEGQGGRTGSTPRATSCTEIATG